VDGKRDPRSNSFHLHLILIIFGIHNEQATEVSAIARQLFQTLKERTKSQQKSSLQLVITQDKQPVLVLSEHLPASGLSFPVPLLPIEQLIDTIGAGDAFVGGFLAKRLLNCSLLDCVQTGIFCARQVIGVSGCQLIGSFDQTSVQALFPPPSNGSTTTFEPEN
jgi:sugar/nucleoside kinase (ribokinase family)